MFPACVLFRELLKSDHLVSMVTDGRGEVFCADIEPKIVLDTVRYSDVKIFGVVSYLIGIFFRFLRLWRRETPDVVVGFGGILTVVPLVVGKILGAKVVVYEQNSIVGRANRFLKKIADLRLSTFDLGSCWTRVAAPVREEFGRNVHYHCGEKITLLVIGGSQGAASFTRIIPDALRLLEPSNRRRVEIIQQVGEADAEKLRMAYEDIGVKAMLEKFLHHVSEIMAVSQLVICRSGASTLSELSTVGRPAILIPYPSSSDDHQLHNAAYYGRKKAAWVLEETEEIAEKLARLLEQILSDPELLKSAASNMIWESVGGATGDFVKFVENAAKS
jgi:UDP-N-acetylglucosamine--N-acetylmuramyl-(pentapeptide) pyrophosphoryl-undecaprenol N-acetylglucosamine transferase